MVDLILTASEDLCIAELILGWFFVTFILRKWCYLKNSYVIAFQDDGTKYVLGTVCHCIFLIQFGRVINPGIV